jgi:hypothetical protein
MVTCILFTSYPLFTVLKITASETKISSGEGLFTMISSTLLFIQWDKALQEQ